MNLKFIGTGSMGHSNCNTSIMIENILFDIGNGIVYNIDQYGISLSSIDYLVITHFHGDHFSDITNLLIARKIRGVEKLLTIIGPTGVKQKIVDLFVFLYGDGEKNGSDIPEKYNIEFVEVKDREEYTINDKVLKAYKLEHGINKEVLGYTYDNKVAYLVDTTLCDSLYELCDGIEHILADVTTLETTAAHIGLSDYINLASKYNNSKFYAIHRNDYNITDIKNINFPEDGEELIIN